MTRNQCSQVLAGRPIVEKTGVKLPSRHEIQQRVGLAGRES